ncbi:histone-like nucleoid-structuring protein Lsr2 [Corynebacterium aurimucosum]|uniref:histone-like nucleoid-structuring protein Lsr2 n=1 Tax=Corynebacterium aurimucosum TaxID=169292 RepID=UPI00399099A9
MARREITQFFDDIDNKPLSEEELVVIRFSVDGKDYLLDVSQENADKFHAALGPFIKAARHPVKKDTRRYKPADVRVWAAKHGYQVAERGKIPNEVILAYRNANNL